MRGRFLIVIGVSGAINLALIAVLGFNLHDEGSDCAGMELWDESSQRWMTMEPVPEGSVLPACRIKPKKTWPGEYRPV